MLQKTVLENSLVMNSSIFVETAWSLWMKEFFKSYNLFNHCLYQLTCSNTASINQSVQALSLCMNLRNYMYYPLKKYKTISMNMKK